RLGFDPAAVHLPLLRAILAQGRYSDALREIDIGPELSGEERIAQLQLEGAALRGLGRNPAAEATLRSALELDPDSLAIRTDLAALMLAQNRIEEGRRLVIDVLTDEPTYSAALLLRSMLELGGGRLDEAEA